MINVNNVWFGYNKNEYILKGVSLNIKKGEILNILGANGCGKSTLIKLILAFYKLQQGNILINNKNLDKISRKELVKYLSYVPQSHHAAFPYTVRDIVVMGRSSGSLWRNYSKYDYEVAESVLDSLKIYHLKDKDYSKLSGGQRQLVMVARAVVQNAQFCFMDEPVSSLDFGNQYRLLKSVKEYSEKGFTFVITTHHPDHVKYLGGRALLMKDGVIYKDGSYQDVINEETMYQLYKVKTNKDGKVYEVD